MSKEKQIEEMARTLCGEKEKRCQDCDSYDLCEFWIEASTLHYNGYRKQCEGEWETIPDYSRSLITYRHICSVCKTFYKDVRPHGHKYCHECGAKMKGGVE